MKQARKIKVAAFLFAFFFILWRLIFIPITDERRGRDSNHGDLFSDQNVYSAALYFNDYGFSKSAWLPVHNYKGKNKASSVYIYTHYPAVPDVLGGIFMVINHSKDPRLLRIWPTIFSVGLFFLIFYGLKVFLKDEKLALASGVILVLSNYFIGFGDSLHKHIYEELFKWSFVLILYRYYTDGRRNKSLIGWLSLLMVVGVNISFELVVYSAVITVGFSIVFLKRIFNWENFILGFASITGLALHFLQNSIALGGWEKAWEDQVSSFGERTSGQDLAIKVGLKEYLTFPVKFISRIERMYAIPGWTLVLMSYWLIKWIREYDRQLGKILLVLLIAGYSWALTIFQHAYVHEFTVRQMSLFYGIIIGPALFIYMKKFREYYDAKAYWKFSFVILIGIYSVGMFLTQQVWQVFLKRALLYPFMG